MSYNLRYVRSSCVWLSLVTNPEHGSTELANDMSPTLSQGVIDDSVYQ